MTRRAISRNPLRPAVSSFQRDERREVVIAPEALDLFRCETGIDGGIHDLLLRPELHDRAQRALLREYLGFREAPPLEVIVDEREHVVQLRKSAQGLFRDDYRAAGAQRLV